MTEQSRYWLNITVNDILVKNPDKDTFIVASGISPSASYHIGHFREVLTADALAWGLRNAGKQVRHLHFVDNYDPLRKRYHFLPEEYERYVGWPICLVPAPDGSDKSYATYYSEEFQKRATQMGIDLEVIYSYEDQYLSGKMVPMIEASIDKVAEIRSIFNRVAHRTISDDWMPIQILADNKSFNDWQYKSIDTKTKLITYVNTDGKEGKVSYAEGRVKLNWRLDWPARWALWNVEVEPFGKEHATKGGSYDTGAEFVQSIFKYQPPYPLAYDTINLVGDNKKMSSSLGNLVTPKEALEIMPPEILRYFVLRSLPKKVLYFDKGAGLYNLIDEFSKVQSALAEGSEHEFSDAYRVSTENIKQRTISSIPFNHLVNVLQAAGGDFEETVTILRRSSEYHSVVTVEEPEIRRELEYVKNWLNKWAPKEVIFTIEESVEKVVAEQTLSKEQKLFLGLLADKIQVAPEDADGAWFHNAIYELKTEDGLGPSEMFKTIYLVLIMKEKGPRAGWFLSMIARLRSKEWLLKRLRLEA